ncbi:hypothetical protein L484_028062 [Morus notabilis]|uniref:Uncharacterized protein n=1 Tax=Morus notabilis TaxID=981085 RepID=W9SFZ8_9ROSA|nr:hypothetical protein L484_028062 [Morus notabilis]
MSRMLTHVPIAYNILQRARILVSHVDRLMFVTLQQKFEYAVNLVGVPEWLSGMTRNHVGSARAGTFSDTSTYR